MVCVSWRGNLAIILLEADADKADVMILDQGCSKPYSLPDSGSILGCWGILLQQPFSFLEVSRESQAAHR
jgi:hypothetical protein